MERENFGTWLQAKLDERGWSQADLARKTKIDTGYVSKLLNGTRDPGPVIVRKLARGLGLPEDTVFSAAGLLAESPDRQDEQTSALTHMFSVLNADDRQDILDWMRMKIDRQEAKQRNDGHRRIP